MDAYDGQTILCRRCLEQPPDIQALSSYLDEYAASLPESVRVPEAVYRRRLEACAVCPKRIQFTCVACGCYVQARAAKRLMRCPLVPPQWRAFAEGSEEREEPAQ